MSLDRGPARCIAGRWQTAGRVDGDMGRDEDVTPHRPKRERRPCGADLGDGEVAAHDGLHALLPADAHACGPPAPPCWLCLCGAGHTTHPTRYCTTGRLLLC